MLKAKLVIVGGDAKAGEISLALPTTIGRGKEADLTIPHALVSRAHTKLFEREGALWVEDLGSLNGTFVDNTRIESEQELKPNQLLTLGNITFRAVYEINQSSRKTLPATKLPDSFETVTIDPIAIQNAAEAPVFTSDDGDDFDTKSVQPAVSREPAIESEPMVESVPVTKPEPVTEPEFVTEPESVFEETASGRSAISEIDSFDPEEIGSLDSVSEKLKPNEMAPQTSKPKKPHIKPTTSNSPQPKPRMSPAPKKSAVVLRKLPVEETVPQEASIDLGIPEHAPVAAVSSVDLDLPDDTKPAPASFIGKIQTGDANAASFVEDFQIELDSDNDSEADVDASRLDSFMKRLPK